jgi:CHAT domain-containing protein
LDAARLEYESFQNALYVTHPEMSLRSGGTHPITYADLGVLVEPNDTAYLEYVVLKDRVSLFVATKAKANDAQNLKVYTLSIKPDDLVKKVNQFHDMLAEARPMYASAAHELYALLIEPAEQQLRGIETICIIPDSFLWNVPFQALMTTNDHYLIEDHAVYYAPSLSVLRKMNGAGKRSKMNPSLIAFGNPVIGQDEQHNTELCPLQDAETEVNSIAKGFGPADSKVFIGREATEKTFRALASNYSILHLATHGVIDNRQPLYSHLLLTKTEGDPESDGSLEAREIMDMDLHADLVVLSACETANGKISSGEGVMGLSWAFFIAGTRSMLVSQWRVDSASTSQLMASFYDDPALHKVDSNGKKASALRNAVLTLIKDQRYSHSYYWAAFVLVGHN